MNLSALIFSGVCFAAVGFALVSQHFWDMQPCPWCIAQRIVLLIAGVLALMGAIFSQRARILMFVAALPLAGGVVMAAYQHWVAKYQSSCSFSKAETFIRWTQIDQLAPWLFEITATCADAANATLAGVPYELASGIFQLLLFLVALFWFKNKRHLPK
jgi:protein dithiol:quinone oxidoreductase